MTNTVKGAGRRRYEANKKHQQRTPLPPRNSTAIKQARDIVAEEVKAVIAEKPQRVSKAQELALAAEGAGWEVERIINGNRKTVRATRSESGELLEANWENNRACEPMGFYEINGRRAKLQHVTVAKKIMATPPEVAARNAENIQAARKAPRAVSHRTLAQGVPFDPATATDEEVLTAILGREITWRNVLSNGEVEGIAVVPESGKQTRLDDDDLRDPATRQLTFCDAEGGGYYTVRLSALLSVGALKDEGGRMLTDTRHRAMMAVKEGSKR